MFKAIENEFLIGKKSSFSVANAPTIIADRPDDKKAKKKLSKIVDKIDDLQRVLYADDKHSMLLVFQAMDAAGKDSTIRAVTRGVKVTQIIEQTLASLHLRYPKPKKKEMANLEAMREKLSSE